ncbi:MAG TPA: phosphatidate cytidylyltransferase [Thermoanaerobaculia bacterium]|nr:phosphatidate cytidylyltransferase [Thermoanaerobaculia bacterium]
MRFQRELTAAVLIPAVVAVLVFAPLWAWALLVAAAAALALVEFYRLLEAAGGSVPKPAGVVLLLALLAAAHLRSPEGLAIAAGATLLVLPTLVLFSSPPVPALLPSSAGSAFATLYVGLGGSSMIGLRALGWKPVVFLLAAVWASDSAAYYVGRRFGKTKLAPVVSPKKTWEGFGGQIAGGLVAGLAAALILEGGANIGLAAAFGAFVAAIAVVGDLLESTFKRSCAVKDSGGLLPGHGGFLDRLDSLLYASPVVLLVGTWAPEVMPR